MTNKAISYRAIPRWRVTAAFSAAIALHLSAVALASLHHETPIAETEPGFAPVEIDPGEQPAPSQADLPRETPAPILSRQEFVEPEQPRQPILNRRPSVPIRTIGQTPMGAAGNSKALALFAPRPEYPYEARSRRLTGSGTAVLNVNSQTGFVDDVSMEQRIGSPVLDNAAMSAFKRWRFRKGTSQTVRVPISFTLTGAQY
jgi:TonB family protein